jgi:non-ribosomal peptide synthetase-like protein
VDLLSIGDDTIIRQDATLSGYNVVSGHVRPGRISIGSRVYISEATVLDINSQMGDDTQLGTSSCLHENQRVPEGKIYQGSPAVETATNYNRVPPLKFSQFNRNAYTVYLIVTSVIFGFPVLFLIINLLANYGVTAFETSAVNGTLATLSTLLLATFGLYFAGVLLELARVMIMPRLIRPFLVADKVHPLYGTQYHLARLMTGFSNSQTLSVLFGDSSMIVHYLSYLGYDMSESTQTGSNFGVAQTHNSPFLCKFSRNTLVSDGLKLMNVDVSNTSFKISQITMPSDTYLGNAIHYPVGSKVGENCLIATKAMVPIDGETREGVGLLGSPPFEIPRSVLRDQKFEHFKEPSVLKKRLKMKLTSNLWTVALFIFKTISQVFLISCMAWGTWKIFNSAELSSASLSGVLSGLGIISTLFVIFYGILFERIASKFKRMRPLYCSLYDQAFWNHERYWKMSLMTTVGLFSGTPMMSFFLRLRGMKIGKMFFDDGAGFPEPELVSVGDHCTFNAASVIQCHSLEDGTFKSDYVSVGSGCNFGVGAFVHYGTKIESDTTILADSFVMKGSTIGQGITWGGNPAREKLAEQFDALEITQEISPTHEASMLTTSSATSPDLAYKTL